MLASKKGIDKYVHVGTEPMASHLLCILSTSKLYLHSISTDRLKTQSFAIVLSTPLLQTSVLSPGCHLDFFRAIL
jgi:hypothetical protein